MPTNPTPTLPVNSTAVPVKTPTFTFNTGNTSELSRFQRNVCNTLDSVLAYMNLYFGPTPVAKTSNKIKAYAAGSQQITSPAPTILPLTGGLTTKGNIAVGGNATVSGSFATSSGVPHTIGPFFVVGSIGTSPSAFPLAGTSSPQYWVPAFAGSLVGLTWSLNNQTSTTSSLTLSIVGASSGTITVAPNTVTTGGVTFAKNAYRFPQFGPNIYGLYTLGTAVSNLSIILWLTVTESV